MIGIATALWLSKPLRYALVGLAMMASYEFWKVHQQQLGALREKQLTEKAKNADNEKADDVRSAVASAKPFSGLRDPNRRDRDKP